MLTTLGPPTLFLLGNDYHLGDLLWLTPVLAEYARQRNPGSLIVGCPDRDLSRILENAPPIDRIIYGSPHVILHRLRTEFGSELDVHDLRMVPVAIRMLQEWRYHLPWLYYWDLWVQPRGQWLSTFLHLGTLTRFRPEMRLVPEDREGLPDLPSPYVLLAPHTGSYSLPGFEYLWRRIKGWETDSWMALASLFEQQGYAVVTVGARDQAPIPGTIPLLGQPIRKAAAVIEAAAALVTGESGLWFVAAAMRTPFVIVPWWLPRSIDWPKPMGIPYRLVRRNEAIPARVFGIVQELLGDEA